MIDYGTNHTICLNYSGDIFSFGVITLLGVYIENTNTHKSTIDLTKTHIPQKINLPPCKQVSCGENFTMCLTEDNIIFIW